MNFNQWKTMAFAAQLATTGKRPREEDELLESPRKRPRGIFVDPELHPGGVTGWMEDNDAVDSDVEGEIQLAHEIFQLENEGEDDQLGSLSRTTSIRSFTTCATSHNEEEEDDWGDWDDYEMTEVENWFCHFGFHMDATAAISKWLNRADICVTKLTDIIDMLTFGEGCDKLTELYELIPVGKKVAVQREIERLSNMPSTSAAPIDDYQQMEVDEPTVKVVNNDYEFMCNEFRDMAVSVAEHVVGDISAVKATSPL